MGREKKAPERWSGVSGQGHESCQKEGLLGPSPPVWEEEGWLGASITV